MNKLPLLVLAIVFLGSFYRAAAQADDWRDQLVCSDGEKKACGANMGACTPGERTCASGKWGDCVGGTTAVPEVCDNKIDDDCNGQVDDCSFEFPVPGWMLISIGVLMFMGAWVYEKLVAVKKEEISQQETI
jgi:hypothetical protein